MRRHIASLLLAGLVLLSLAGCGNVFAREYVYSEPFTVNYGGAGGDATEISNYSMLKSALQNLIAQHRESAAFRFGNYNGSVVDDLAAACLEVRTSHPLGAYAVETLSYDASRIVSYYTANIAIGYKRSAEEIASIQNVVSTFELETVLREALEAFQDRLVLRVYSAQADEDYIAALIETLCFQEPAAIPAAPEAAVTGYPGEGPNRIFELRLGFPYGEERMAAMSRQISESAAAMALEASAGADSRPVLALRLAENLSSLTAEGGGSGGTAYTALAERSAGAKGFALAFKALCDAAGIDCVVVRGSIGGMGAGEHYWNMISLEGSWYHADISRFGEDPARSFLMDDEGFWGEYIWDTDAYPACTGSLRYHDLVPEAEEPPARPVRPDPGTETPEEPPEETPPPEETAPPEASEPPETPPPPEETPPPETSVPPEESPSPEEPGDEAEEDE